MHIVLEESGTTGPGGQILELEEVICGVVPKTPDNKI